MSRRLRIARHIQAAGPFRVSPELWRGIDDLVKKLERRYRKGNYEPFDGRLSFPWNGRRENITVFFVPDEYHDDVEFGGEAQPGDPSFKYAAVVFRWPKPGELDAQKMHDFWTSMRETTLHEVIHCLDAKLTDPALNEKMPPYPYRPDVDILATPEERELARQFSDEYAGHPLEQTAFEGAAYAYFKRAKQQKLHWKEALAKYLDSSRPNRYRDWAKKHPQVWQDYLTRLYKSAQRAYQET